MGVSRRDVSLVIRAKDEASKAFDATADALASLFTAGKQAGAGAAETAARLEQLASVAVAVDRAYAKINATADGASAAFDRQRNSLAESRTQLEALRGQADAAASAMERLKGADAIVSAGRDQSQRIRELGDATAEYARLQQQMEKLKASITTQEAALDNQRSSLQQIGSTAIAAADAQDRLAAEIENEAQAMQRAAVAAEKLSTLQEQINRVTGVSRDGVGDASASAEILAQVAAHDELIQRLKAEQRAETELAEAQDARRRAALLLPGDATSGKSAQGSAGVFSAAYQDDLGDAQGLLRANAAEMKNLDAAAAKLRAQLDPMAEIQARLNKELAEATKLYLTDKISAEELAKAQALLKDRADQAAKAIGKDGVGSSKNTLFGLSPYALQNLSFQINDVVTQLLSGTSLTQTLAQQGGQILQIFPRVGEVLVSAFKSPPILALVTGVALLALGLKELERQQQVIRDFDGLLTASADSATMQASALGDAASQIDRYGLSAKDTVAVVRTFMKEGLNPDRFVEFGRTALDMADVLKIDVTQAAEQLASGFSGGYDAIKKLDDATNALTATEMDRIRQLFAEGKAAEARALAYETFADKYDAAAQKQRGPWTEAMRSLSGAWSEFLDLLSKTSIVDGMAKKLDWLGDKVGGILRAINGTRTEEDVQADIDVTEKLIAALQKNGRDTTKFQGDLTKLKQELTDLQNKGRSGADPKAQATERQKKVDTDLALADKKRLAAAKELTHEQRLQLAYDDALKAAQDLGASDAAAKASAENARLIERKKIEEEITKERDKQRRIWAEDLANSSNDRLVDTAKRFDGMNERANKGDLQKFFSDNGVKIDPEMTAWCAAFVNAVLKTNGIKGTGSNLAKSFLGFGQEVNGDPKNGDIVVLKRGKDPTQGHVGFFQGFDEKGNVRVLGGNQKDGVNTQPFKRDDVVGIRRAPSQGDIAKQQFKEAQDLVKVQENFNERVKEEVDRREQNIAAMKAQKGLVGEELIAEQRKQAVANARQSLEQQAAKINTDRRARGLEEIRLTEEQIKKVEELTGVEFDLAHARDVASARRADVDNVMNDLAARKAILEQQIELLQRTGDASVSAIMAQLADVNVQLDQARTNVIQFWAGVLAGENGGPEAFGMTAAAVANLVAQLQAARAETQGLNTQFLMTGRQINETLAQGMTNAWDNFTKNVAAGKNVFKSAGQAFLQFAADFLRQIGLMIIKQIAFNFVAGLFGGGAGGSGGAGGQIASSIGKLFHSGGVVGEPGEQRRVSNAIFSNAVRYHEGGIAGLKPGEVPAILKEGEEVLTEENPRHINNAGRGRDTGGGNVKVINAWDPLTLVSEALSTPEGTKVILNVVKNSPNAFKAAMD